MPYAFDGVCFDTPDNALQAFNRSFPKVDGSGVAFLSSSSVTSAGMLTYQMIASDGQSRSASVQLASCPDSSLAQYSIHHIVFVIALFFAFTRGFSTGFKR